MIRVRNQAERGHTRRDGLDSRHSFAFGDYFDPAYAGFGVLRVLNEDRVAPGKGFPTHGHQDMEIVTYLLEGQLEHRDSLGNGSVIQSGEIQRLSAGTGMTHSEYNPSAETPVHFLQIWIEPKFRGLPPSYEQKELLAEMGRRGIGVLASPDGREGSLTIHQDALILRVLLEPGNAWSHSLSLARSAYVQVTRGSVRLNGQPLKVGDGAAVEDEAGLDIMTDKGAEVLVFDLP